MKTILMVYPDSVMHLSDNAFGWFEDEAERLGISLQVLTMENFSVVVNPLHILYNAQPVVLPDVIVMRGYDYVLSMAFETFGVRVINSTLSMQRAQNKMIAHCLFEKAGLPSLHTIYGRGISYVQAKDAFGSNVFVVKELTGSKGKQVWIVKNEKDYNKLLWQYNNENLLLQEYLESSCGRDVRVWVIGGKAVACVERYSDNDFRSNLALGGMVKPHSLTQAIKDLSEKAANCVGLDFAGVDLLFTPQKDTFAVCEVNGNAGFRSISKIGGENIPRLFLEFILTLS
jgi:gamma-F420-2:alpha-L-glutamate ligase